MRPTRFPRARPALRLRPAMAETALGVSGFVVTCLVTVALAASGLGPVPAAERHDVVARTFEFDPRDLTIAPGDTVQWIHESGTHTVTEGADCSMAEDPRFNVELTGAHPTFRYVFDTPGLVSYYCIPHCVIMDMQGTVRVTGGTEGRVFEADGDGGQMVPPVETDATAKLRAYLSSGEDRLHVQVTVENLTNEMTACHLHLGAPGSNGPQVVNLGAFEDSLALDVVLAPTLVAPLRAGNLYVAIHTVPYPVGEVRGQLSAVAAHTFEAVLDASQSVNPVDSDGVGFAEVYVWPDSTRLHLGLVARELTSSIIGAHIHEAPPGQDGPIVFNLGPFDDRVVRDFATTPSEITTLAEGGYYLNIHTAQYLFGEIRGQLGTQTVSGLPDAGAGDPEPAGNDGGDNGGGGSENDGGPGDGAPGTSRAGRGLAVAVRPSITAGPFDLAFTLTRRDAVAVAAFAADGRRICDWRLEGRPGRNQVRLELPPLPRGRVYLTIDSGGTEAAAEITIAP